jgi:uncharacterized integral membrane protein
MKNVLTALVVLAVVVLAVGVASHGSRVDLDYVAGTWHHVSLLSLAAVVAVLLVVVGVLAGVAVDLSRARDRRALHAELERTYARLRAAEAETAGAPAADSVAGADSAGLASSGAVEPSDGDASARVEPR